MVSPSETYFVVGYERSGGSLILYGSPHQIPFDKEQALGIAKELQAEYDRERARNGSLSPRKYGVYKITITPDNNSSKAD